jgi:rare lipoprotein A
MWICLGGLQDVLWADAWYTEQGHASWYGKEFAGRQTANGETFSPNEMTAAHRKLPLGTKVMVENPATGEKAEVKINDRGPYADPKRRIIDLSRAAAHSVGLVERGVGPVKLTVTEPASSARKGDEDYEVQVGAFADEQEAQYVLSAFQETYPSAYIDPRHGPEGIYYRVRLGPFETEARALRVAQTLKQEGHKIFIDELPDTNNSSQHPAAGDQPQR